MDDEGNEGNDIFIGVVSVNCTFEGGDMCGYELRNEDSAPSPYRWGVFSGGTPTRATGPSHDHTVEGDKTGKARKCNYIHLHPLLSF